MTCHMPMARNEWGSFTLALGAFSPVSLQRLSMANWKVALESQQHEEMQPEKLPASITLWTTCSFERQKISMWHPGCTYPIPLQFNLLSSERNRITSPFLLCVFHMPLKNRKFKKIFEQIPAARRKQKHSGCHASRIQNSFSAQTDCRKDLPQSWPRCLQFALQQQQNSYLASDLLGSTSFVSMCWSKGWWAMIKEQWVCWPETLMRMKWEGQWSSSHGKLGHGANLLLIVLYICFKDSGRDRWQSYVSLLYNLCNEHEK